MPHSIDSTVNSNIPSRPVVLSSSTFSGSTTGESPLTALSAALNAPARTIPPPMQKVAPRTMRTMYRAFNLQFSLSSYNLQKHSFKSQIRRSRVQHLFFCPDGTDHGVMFETSPPNTSRKPSHSDTESPQLTDQFGPIRCTDALSSAATVTSAMASIERWTCAASLWMDNTTAL